MRSDYDVVEKVIGYLEQSYLQQPELRDVAAQVGLSEAHVQRVFRRWAGVSPKRFVQFLTAQHARELLRSSASVLATSYAVGLSGGSRLYDLMINILAATPGEVKSGGAGVTVEYGVHATQFGDALLAVTARGLCTLAFLQPEDPDQPLRELRERWPQADLRENPRATSPVARQIFGDEHGQLTLHLKGTNFQIRVWEALLRIPPGHVVTYENIAQSIGRPTAVRAVGAAIGQNPVAYLIPCHRVLRKSGAFGEYHWGGARKKALLAWESARALGTPAA